MQACQETQTTDHQVVDSINSTENPDTNTPQITPQNFVGYWMPEDYLQKIETQKSIYELDDDESKNPLYGFIIDQNTEEVTLRGFGTHEGGLDAPLHWNAKKMRFEVNNAKIQEHHILQAGTYLEYKTETQIQIVTPEKKTVFRRVEDDKKEFARILFSGTYQNKNGEIISFAQDGSLAGLPPKSQYKILSDFGEGLLFDVVFFKNPEDSWTDQLMFHFKIKGNTLELYPITGDFPEVEYEIGEIKYHLTKK